MIEKPQSKLRGIPRRLRALKNWSEYIGHTFPPEAAFYAQGYWNHKVPVDWALVEGKQSTIAIRREVAHCLIQACQALIEAKPQWALSYRVTCLICLPDMHASELCIFSSEEYFQSKCGELNAAAGIQSFIGQNSLSREWQLELPQNVSELGIRWQYDKDPDPEQHYVSEHWVYGEVR